LRNPYNLSHCKGNVDANPHLPLEVKLGKCIRVPTVVWTEIDGYQRLVTNKNRVGKNRTLKQNKVREARNIPLSLAI